MSTIIFKYQTFCEGCLLFIIVVNICFNENKVCLLFEVFFITVKTTFSQIIAPYKYKFLTAGMYKNCIVCLYSPKCFLSVTLL